MFISQLTMLTSIYAIKGINDSSHFVNIGLRSTQKDKYGIGNIIKNLEFWCRLYGCDLVYID